MTCKISLMILAYTSAVHKGPESMNNKKLSSLRNRIAVYIYNKTKISKKCGNPL